VTTIGIASSSLSEVDYRAQLGGSDSEQQPTPSPRIKPGNIAYAAVFLASEESDMITGHILPVDRGIGD